jgi:hypothetical protein
MTGSVWQTPRRYRRWKPWAVALFFFGRAIEGWALGFGWDTGEARRTRAPMTLSAPTTGERRVGLVSGYALERFARRPSPNVAAIAPEDAGSGRAPPVSAVWLVARAQ